MPSIVQFTCVINKRPKVKKRRIKIKKEKEPRIMLGKIDFLYLLKEVTTNNQTKQK